MSIYVTKPYMPPEIEFEGYVKKIFERGYSLLNLSLINEGDEIIFTFLYVVL